MKINFIKTKEQGFFLILVTIACISTAGFALLYNSWGIHILGSISFTLCGLFLLCFLGVYLKIKTAFLFRFGIALAYTGFCIKIFFTGGIDSSAIVELFIPPLMSFFYKPVRDRYFFQGFSFLALFTFFMLSRFGMTPSALLPEYESAHSLIIMVYVFTIISIFIYIFKKALDNTEKLIQSEKMASLGVMSAGVAHEINNPLNFIKGGIEVLGKELKKQETLSTNAEQCIHVIEEGVSRAATIVKSLSHFSRETDSMDELCDVHNILDNCVIMLNQKLKYKIDLDKKYFDGVVELMGNEGKLHQAFLNIILNAENAIEEKGQIFIETKSYKNHLQVKIQDSGKGISKENLLKIRDPFFTTKTVGSGTGLGLTITYKIIEEHNGSISVTSEIGNGTTFIIDFKIT